MRLLIVLCLATMCVAVRSHAAFTDDFDELRGELASRSLLLSNSVDKTEIKQKKLCDQSIALIDKPATSLATDIKTAKKVATKVIKAFPNEFIAVNAGGIILSNNMFNLVFGTYTNLGTDVYAEIVTLGGLIAGLPDGPDKLKAGAQFNIATNLLALAQPPFVSSFAQASALLGKSLKAALKGQTIANNAGGGSGGTNSISATVVIGGSNYNWSATGGAEWVQNAGILDIGGSDGGLLVSAAQCTNFNGATGNYALGDSCGGVNDIADTFHFYGATTGTLHIATFDAPTTSLSGTFAYEASDGVTTVTVTNGMFNLNNLLISNNP